MGGHPLKSLNLTLFLLTTITLLFSGCGGGGGSTTSDPIIKSGNFIDSAVKGISYATTTKTGTTDIDGKFTYTSTDTAITFKLGNITLSNFNLSDINPDGKVLPTDKQYF